VANQFDESDFVDAEFQAGRSTGYTPPAGGATVAGTAGRPPTREELDQRVAETQQRLGELRDLQERLEQERVALEEARRRRGEYHTGREEMMEHLTRGVGLLEEAEFKARQEAEQLARSLQDLRDHLLKVQSLDDQSWGQETYAVELTRALTTIENARMEWNSARLKWTLLNPTPAVDTSGPIRQPGTLAELSELGLGRLCRLGLGLTWPLALVLLLAAAALVVAWFAR